MNPPNISDTSAFKMKIYPFNAKIGEIMLYLGRVRGKSIAVFLSRLEVHLKLKAMSLINFLGVYLDEHLT